MMATSIKAISDEPVGSLARRIPGSVGAPLAVFFHGVGGYRFSWDPQLNALGGLRWCLGCDLLGYGRSPGLPSALPELARTGWGAGLFTSSARTTLSAPRFPAPACSASSTWGDGRAGQTCDPYHGFEAKGHVRLPAHGCAGGHQVPCSACWFGAPAAVGGGVGAGDRPGGDGGVRPGWLRQVDVAGGLGAALPVAGGVAVAGCRRQRPGQVLAVCGRGARSSAAGGGRAGRRAA